MTLLLRPSIETGEGPQGFLLRLAEANGLSLAALRDIGVHYDLSLLGRLGYLPDRFSSTVAGQCAHAVDTSLQTEVRAWNHDVPRYCAQCLEESAHWRFEWEIVFGDACPRHGIWLRDRCSACGQILTWHRPELLRCECGAALRAERHQNCPEAVSALSSTLRQAVSPGADRPALHLLNGLALGQVQRLIRFLAAYGGTSQGRFPQKMVAVTRLDVSWQITSLASEIITGWPDTFFRILERMQSSDATNGSLSRRFGHCYTVLYRGFPEPQFDFLRRSFEEYLADHWRGAFGRRNRRLIGKLPRQMAWVPAVTACTILGVSKRRLDHLVRQNRIAAEERTGPSGRRFLVLRLADVKTEAQKLLLELDLSSSAHLLGVNERRFATLLPHLIPEACKPDHIKGTWTVPRQNIDRLLQFVNQVSPVDTVAEDCVSLAHVMKYWPWSDKAVAECIKTAVTGSLKPVGRLAPEGLGGIVYRRNLLTDWHQATQQVQLSSLSVPQLAARLRVKQEVAYSLVRNRFIDTYLVRAGRRDERRVTADSLAAFGDRYIFGRDIAENLATSPRSLAEKLSRLGIEPCSGPHVDDCRQILYERSAALLNALRSLNSFMSHSRNGQRPASTSVSS